MFNFLSLIHINREIQHLTQQDITEYEQNKALKQQTSKLNVTQVDSCALSWTTQAVTPAHYMTENPSIDHSVSTSVFVCV